MSNSFSFSYSIERSGNKKALRAVLFFSTSAVEEGELLEALDQYYYNNPVPDELWLVGTDFNSDSILKASSNLGFTSRLRQPVRGEISRASISGFVQLEGESLFDK